MVQLHHLHLSGDAEELDELLGSPCVHHILPELDNESVVAPWQLIPESQEGPLELVSEHSGDDLK